MHRIVFMPEVRQNALDIAGYITDELDSPEAAGRITTALVNAAE